MTTDPTTLAARLREYATSVFFAAETKADCLEAAAIIDRLPKTADGVPWIIGDPLWAPPGLISRDAWKVPDGAWVSPEGLVGCVEELQGHCVAIADSFSTAEAARVGKE